MHVASDTVTTAASTRHVKDFTPPVARRQTQQAVHWYSELIERGKYSRNLYRSTHVTWEDQFHLPKQTRKRQQNITQMLFSYVTACQKSMLQATLLYNIKRNLTRSSVVAERPLEAPFRWKFCSLKVTHGHSKLQR